MNRLCKILCCKQRRASSQLRASFRSHIRGFQQLDIPETGDFFWNEVQNNFFYHIKDIRDEPARPDPHSRSLTAYSSKRPHESGLKSVQHTGIGFEVVVSKLQQDTWNILEVIAFLVETSFFLCFIQFHVFFKSHIILYKPDYIT